MIANSPFRDSNYHTGNSGRVLPRTSGIYRPSEVFFCLTPNFGGGGVIKRGAYRAFVLLSRRARGRVRKIGDMGVGQGLICYTSALIVPDVYSTKLAHSISCSLGCLCSEAQDFRSASPLSKINSRRGVYRT